jgi:type II secretory pathway component PulF
MNQSFGTFNLLLLAVPGAALLLCVRLLYGPRPSAMPDSTLLALRMAGRVMLLAALGGVIFSTAGLVVGIILTLVTVVIWIMTLDRRMRLDHQALLASIGVAVEKGIPLPEVVLAFADEMNSGGARRALWLAQALQQGVPLDQALSYAWIKCSTATRMAVRVGISLGALAPALRSQAKTSDELEDLVRPMLSRWIYLFNILFVGEYIVAFIMIWIVPVFDKMFQEFGLKLPGLTVCLINLSRWIVDYGWFLLLMFTMGAVAASLASVFAFIGWLPRSAPILNRIFRRYDGAIVLRSLALAIRRGQPLNSALRLMAEIYPLGTVRSWLGKASAAVEGGQDWCAALRQVRLIDRTDEVVLRSAQAAGNLPWALEEMAESLLRREVYRWQAWYNILSPILILVMGICVGFICVAIFLPLIGMIQGLA